MRTTLEIMIHCLSSAIKHPRTTIKQKSNPVPMELSPIPWWGSILILVLGIVSWCFATKFSIEGLDEAARAMVYCPLMHIFDMSWFLSKKVKK